MTQVAALKRRLDMFEAIEADAKAALMEAAEDAVAIDKGQRIREAGGPAEEFWVVAEGWFYSSGTLADGGRQVYAFHLPGDVMGLQDLGWEVAVCDVTAATKGSIVRIEKRVFRQLIATYPVLAGFFLTFGIYDHTRLIDQLRVIGRMPGVKRVAHLLLQLADAQVEPKPLGMVANDEVLSLHLPIDQSLIGDALGLTNISVSRMMSELEDLGYISRQGRVIRLPEVTRMKAFANYTERQRAVPLSWLLRQD